MTLLEWFRQLARYNRVANERLYDACSSIDETEYRKTREVSFGSIHALLNHLLLADRIWMARFEGGGAVTPALNTVLFDRFSDLKDARTHEDARIEDFFHQQDDAFLSREFQYVNNKGLPYIERAPVAVGHFFNHQTHHRGQLHAILAQTPASAPSFDLHRVLNP